MNTVSSSTPHNAAARRKRQTNTSRIDKTKNDILSTERVDRTRRPVDRADNPSCHNKRRMTDTIDHRFFQILHYGHDCDMDTEKFTDLDRANVEIRKFRNVINRKEDEKRKLVESMGKSAKRRIEEHNALKKKLTERDAEISNLKSAASKYTTASRKIIANIQSRLGEAEEAKEEITSVCERQAQTIEELRIANSDLELKSSSGDVRLAERDKSICVLNDKLKQSEMDTAKIMSQLKAAEEMEVKQESVLLKVQTELEETKVRQSECEKEKETSGKQTEELKAQCVDYENKYNDLEKSLAGRDKLIATLTDKLEGEDL